MRIILATMLLTSVAPAFANAVFLQREMIKVERGLPALAPQTGARPDDQESTARLDQQWQWLRSVAEAHEDVEMKRKARSLAALVEQVRLAPEGLAYGAPPELSATVLVDERVARSCEHAIAFGLGAGRRVPIAAGESLWFRVELPDAKLVRLSTRGSTVDASLSVHPDCRSKSDEPIMHADDEYGLQAEVALPPGKQTFWYARLTNESDQSGEATIFATLTATLQGTIRSRVGDVPVGDRQISLWRVQGQTLTPVTGAFSGANGNWTIPFVEPGIYAIRTRRNFGSPGLLDQAFSNIPCGGGADFESCGTPGNRYTPFSIDSGEVRSIDFRLDAGAVVTGMVRNAQTGAPIPGARVRATDANAFGTEISISADNGGRYRIEGLFPGAAFLSATASGFDGQIYDGVPCPEMSCWPSAPGATPLPTNLAQPAVANFSLRESGGIRVAVTVNGQVPITQLGVLMGRLLNPAGQIVGSAFAIDGTLFFPSVPPGTYRIYATSNRTIPQLYQSVLCTTAFCDLELQQGTEVVVPATGGTINLAMDLRWRPTVIGTVTEEGTGLPIRDATVRLLPAGSAPGETAQTDWAGRYRFEGVTPGSYRLHASSLEHLDELFDNVACEDPFFADCPGAALFTFTNDSADITADFSLRRSGQLEMIVSGSSLFGMFANLDVRLLTPTGQLVKSYASNTGQMGRITLRDVPPGTHLLAVSLPGHASQLHSLVDCAGTGTPPAGCPLSAATPITVVSGQATTGLRFDLRRNHGVVPVRVRSSVSGGPLVDVPVDVWNAAGIRIGVERTRFDGVAWVGQPVQFPFGPLAVLLSTDNQQGFIDEVYDNRPCPNGPAFLGLCPLMGAAVVTIPGTGAGGQIVIDLDPRDDLFANGFEP